MNFCRSAVGSHPRAYLSLGLCDIWDAVSPELHPPLHPPINTSSSGGRGINSPTLVVAAHAYSHV